MLKLMTLIVVTSLYGTAVAQELVIYPAKGQSNEQTEKDKYACYSWAKGQTGFDPMVAPQATTPAPAQQTKSVAGGAVRGGVGGAALGAGIGAIAGGSRARAGERPLAPYPVAPSAESEATRKTSRRSRRRGSGGRSSWLKTSRGEIIITGLSVLVWRVGVTRSGKLAANRDEITGRLSWAT